MVATEATAATETVVAAVATAVTGTAATAMVKEVGFGHKHSNLQKYTVQDSYLVLKETRAICNHLYNLNVRQQKAKSPSLH